MNPLPSAVNQMMFHIGIPASREGADKFKKDGGKVIFVLTPQEKEGFQLAAGEAGVTWESDEAVKSFLFENWHLWQGCTVNGNDETSMQRFAKILCEMVELHNFDLASVSALTKDNGPTKNALRNYRWVEDGIPLSRAKGKGTGTLAIILAAGPSLNHQWAQLRRIRQSEPMSCFIVAGRTYRKAMKEGVIPNFVVEVEQFEWDDKIFMFAPEPHPDTVLAFPISVCPGVPRAWPVEKMVMLDHNTAKLMGFEVGAESMAGGNSILHHMMNLALWLGCDQIALAGADLSYPKGNAEDTHADGTFPAWPGGILKAEHSFQPPLMVPANDGGTVESSQAYKNFRLFLEIQIERAVKERPTLKVWNFSPRGQLVKGAPFADIEKWGLSCSPTPPSPLGSVSLASCASSQASAPA